MDDLERQRPTSRRTRALSRAGPSIVVIAVLLVAIGDVAGRRIIQHLMSHALLVPWLLTVVGIVGVGCGFAWITLVSRADPDAGEPTWRYRDF